MSDLQQRFPLLFQISQPSDLRQLTESQLLALAEEIRGFIINTLNISGGHFGANLGTVELTIALHYIFNTPDDRIVWDVGHQAYAHKILTGRRDLLHTIRQPGGLCPFQNRNESPADCFGAGHSSTSISAALGMAIANEISGNQRKAVAIIGDGGLTGGMAFEALNHAGSRHKTNILVVLNDNNMSISPNVGGLNNYVARMLTSRLYVTFREGSKKVLAKMPPVWELAKRTETHFKGMITPGTLFEELGFNYIGPIDGHDLPTLLKTLKNMRDLPGPQFLHVRTLKGKGYLPAEKDPVFYHTVKPGFYDADQNPDENKTLSATVKTTPTYSEVFSAWICDTASNDDKLVAITPAMCEGSGLVRFANTFKDRFHDVGIAEQHAITLAAGLACEGKKPIVAIYSTFLQRAYDQLIHDVCIQNLDVTFAVDRSGIVGGDGATHNGNYDLSYLRCIPNLIVMAPADENECRNLLYTAYQFPGPVAIRYPRGAGPGVAVKKEMQLLPIGTAEIRRSGKKIAILAFGSMVTPAMQAGEELNATVVNMRFIKPLDETLIKKLALENKLLVTIEENVILGGAGSAVNEFLMKKNILIPVLNLGLPDKFIEHGIPQNILADCGLDAKGILAAITQRMQMLAYENPIKDVA